MRCASPSKGWPRRFHGMVSAFSEMGEALLAAFAVEKVSEFFEQFAEMGAQTLKFATLLGTSTEQIGALDLAAKGSDTSLEGLAHSMERLGMTLAQAGGGGEKAKAGLEALGIEAREFQNLAPEKQLEELAEKFSVLKDGINKDAIAMAIMGRAGADMIPFLNRGAEGVREFTAMGERAGSIMGKDVAKAFEETHIKLIEMNASFTGLGIVIASGLKPAFDGIVSAVTHAVQGLKDWIKESGAAKIAGDALIVAGRSLATAWAVSVASLHTLGEVWRLVSSQILNDLTMISKVIVGVFTFDKSAITGAWSEMSAKNTQTYVTAAANMQKITDDLMASIRSAWSSEASHEVEIAQTKNGQLAIEDKKALSARLAALQEEIRVADMKYAAFAAEQASEVKIFAITEEQKTQALRAALETRYSAEMMAVAQEIAITKQGTPEYQKALNDRRTLEEKYFADSAKLSREALEKNVADWQSELGAFQSAWDSQLKGLLSGTTSWASATKNIFGDLVLKMIEGMESMVVKWIGMEIAKTGATTAGVAARNAVESAGASVSSLAQIGNAAAVIVADAAKTFAGIFGFLAPVMGPAAAGPAAAGGATVLGALGAIPAAATGGYVVATGLAQVHANETIVPARLNQPYAPGGNDGGGDTHVHFNVSAMDGNSVQSFFSQNSRQIANILSGYMNANPSYG